ncbi:MAG: (Fe-S)-binding protein [candidate division Zixibacteria bacterium]|nr:(Fe-S)-binding protein [candidate division Zixibacteria bacterium]
MAKSKPTINDFRKRAGQLVDIDDMHPLPLPPPFDKPGSEPQIKPLPEDGRRKIETDLDGVSAVRFARPETVDQKRELVGKFFSGLAKLFDPRSNWTFLEPLFLTMEYCVRCQTCSAACPIFIESGKQEIYRPSFRAEILRRLYRKYVKRGRTLPDNLTEKEIDAAWTMIARLMESSYRCTICRRCAQACPIGADNGLVTRELRKIFSQEMGIAPRALHQDGSVQQLEIGSSTGMPPAAFRDNVSFLEDEVADRTGMQFHWPIDKQGAEILLIHNAGEYLAWPENPMAFAIILEKAGIDYTLSSELAAYDAVNYGVWYDDIQFARVAVRHAEIARRLGVKKIVIGECGHAHKALMVIADRILTGDLNIPRESYLTLLRDIVLSSRLPLDPSRNDDITVTLHDPCNMVRLMGIVQPQREILKAVCNNFREMTPHGVDNFCCGGGSGFAIMQDGNFPDWRHVVSSRAKMRQILNVFQDIIGPEHKKYVCAPCSNCKGAIRDMFAAYRLFETSNILYGGLVELIVNAMTDIEKPFIDWQWH